MDLFYDIMIVLIKVGMFLCLFLPFYLLGKQEKENIKKLDEETKNNPSLYEKNEIIKSYICSNEDRDLDITGSGIKLGIKIVVITLLFGIILIWTIVNFDLSLNIIYFLLCCIFTFLIVSFIAIGIKINLKFKNNIFEFLKNKYGIVEKLKKPSTRISAGKKSELYNMRDKYTFSYKIVKYNCIFSNYYQEILMETGIRMSSFYHYIKRSNIMEYCYDLKKLGLDNVNEEILILPNIEKIIKEVCETKIIFVTIKDGYLIIKKKTIFQNYNTEDARRDVDDVEFFYNKIVKLIINEVKQ